MRLVPALIGGLIGGAIGSAIWAGIAYGTGYELGWIAWGIGILVGIGVRAGAGDWDGAMPGAVAVLISLLSIAAGKYFAISLVFSHSLSTGLPNIDESTVKKQIYHQVALEFAGKQPPVTWPEGKNADNASELFDYPVEVQQEGMKRWDAMPPEEKTKRVAENRAAIAEAFGKISGDMKQQMFWKSFEAFDLIFCGLAAITAFRLASGAVGNDE